MIQCLIDGKVLSASPPPEELAPYAEALESGEVVWIGDRWIFGDTLMTSLGMLPVSELGLCSGLDQRSGEPGSCDVHWFAAYLGTQLVKRAACADATGIEFKVTGETQEI